jgi:MFS family permease
MRIVPLFVVCYFVAYLDRVNVSFAALQMNHDIGLGAAAYGFGAGLFFLTYFLFEVPSNLLLNRYGARRWIARIMLTWGLVAGATAFVQGPASFYTARLLLGAAEAGFQPGIIFFITLWFPADYRARIVGYFMAAVPICGTIGSPISGLLLGVHGLGLAGWQWLYILEALPSILLAVVVLFYLTDRPEQATWLPPAEKLWLTGRLAADENRVVRGKLASVGQALTSPIVLCLALVYFADVAMNNANAFFLPLIVKSLGLSNAATGFVVAIPNLCGVLAVVWWGRRSDRKRERVWHAAGALMLGGLGLLVAAYTGQAVISVAALSLAVGGTLAFTAPFWALSGSIMSGAAAAGGLAAISSIGLIGGFVAPSIMGAMKQLTGSFGSGQVVIAAMAVCGALLLLLIARLRSDLLAPDDAVRRWLNPTLVHEKPRFAREAAAIAFEVGVRADHTVARHDNGDGV